MGCCHATLGSLITCLLQGKAFGPALWGTDAQPPDGLRQGVQCPRGCTLLPPPPCPALGELAHELITSPQPRSPVPFATAVSGCRDISNASNKRGNPPWHLHSLTTSTAALFLSRSVAPGCIILQLARGRDNSWSGRSRLPPRGCCHPPVPQTDGRTARERVAALLWSSSSPGPAEPAAVGKQTGWLPALAC